MYVSKKIREILNEMMNNGEFDKIIKCKGYSMKERKLSKQYYESLKDRNLDEISIAELLFVMPRPVMHNVIACLIPYKVVEANKEDK